MASGFELNNVFRGDFIVAQTEVIFFKQKKKKKKQPTPKRCILLITHDTVALNDPQKDNKPILMFPRNTITDYRYNDNTDAHFTQYKLEVSVWIKDKTHELCIEFPTDDAKKQRDIFIQHFDADKMKPIDNDNHITTQSNTDKQPQTVAAPNTKSQPPISPTRRGIKRKHQCIMNEETLRQRAHKLAKHKYLATLYKTLVGKNVLTPNEFWNEYGKDIDIKHTSNGLMEGMCNHVLSSTIQRETWSLFTLFKDRQNNNLAPQDILEILVYLPEVKLAFEQNVPLHFDEDEFWKSFRQSHYFKRGTTRNVTSGISDKETLMDTLLKEAIAQLQYEERVKNGNINKRVIHKANESNSFAKQLAAIQLTKNKEVDVEGKLKKMREDIAAARAAKNGEMPGDMHKFKQKMDDGLIEINGEDIDVEMKDNNKENKEDNKENEEDGFNLKLSILDPSIDLTMTMDSFSRIEDPGNDDIERWFSQVNRHGMMLLYQSINQRNKAKHGNIQEIMNNVPKINKRESFVDNEYDDIDYFDRLNVETEMCDLKKVRSAEYIDLNIADQSVYWGDDLLLMERDQMRMNCEANELYGYIGKAQKQKKKLSQQDVTNLITHKHVDESFVNNIYSNKGDDIIYNKEILMIYRENGDIRAHSRILDQLRAFQKPMTELVKHYWNCFPANNERLKKALTLVNNLKEYKGKLVKFQNTLAKKSRDEMKTQTVLLQELIDLADKVLEHNKSTQQILKDKNNVDSQTAL